MKVIETTKLGLAGYIKSKQQGFIGCPDGRRLQFESDRDIKDWELEYANSCCRLTDSEVMLLRGFLKG